MVTDVFRRLLDPSQLDIAELEPEEDVQQGRHQEAMSPVVQNLENVAISDPSYQNGQTRNSQGQPSTALPPPPPQPISSVSPVSAMSDKPQKQEPAPTFAPMAYNPAAPAAPEPIAHREDTPPPPEDSGPGLAGAVHDNPQYGRNPSQPWTGVPQAGHQPYQIGSPPSGVPSFGSPPPPPPGSTPSFAGPPTSPPQDPRHHSVAAAAYAPDPHTQMYTQQSQPVETPGSQFYPSQGGPHKPLAHVQPQYADYLSSNTSPPPPQGGYAQYQYTPNTAPQAQPQPQAADPYSVHGQVYRPTEQEHAQHHKEKYRRESAGQGKWDQRAEKLEKKGGKLLKRLGI
jgi:hypothetical protein